MNGTTIHDDMMEITDGKGPLALKIDKQWIYSDDTVMHIATAKALQKVTKETSIDEIGRLLAVEYKNCWVHMGGRAPGGTTKAIVFKLSQNGEDWKGIMYNDRGGGCGAAMRSACIGLVFEDLDRVIAVSIQSGRITHHNPIAYLGAVVSSCFTYFALKKINPLTWGALLFEQVFPKSQEYIIKANREVQKNLGQAW